MTFTSTTENSNSQFRPFYKTQFPFAMLQCLPTLPELLQYNFAFSVSKQMQTALPVLKSQKPLTLAFIFLSGSSSFTNTSHQIIGIVKGKKEMRQSFHTSLRKHELRIAYAVGKNIASYSEKATSGLVIILFGRTKYISLYFNTVIILSFKKCSGINTQYI